MTVVNLICFFLILWLSIIIHEYTHSWVAYKLGDVTPKLARRLSLNPLNHIDIFGTLILPILIIVSTRGLLPPIGYAKPVSINPYNFRHPRRDIAIVSISGPISNLLLFTVLVILLRLNLYPYLREALLGGLILNFFLFLFNMLPFPPLDGYRLIMFFIPLHTFYRYLRIEKWGILLVIFVTLIFFNYLFVPIISSLFNILGINDTIFFKAGF